VPDLPRNVLVVDDERIIADSLATILRSRGYAVQAAYDAQNALNVANEERPDFLISDVMMPGMNGIELSLFFEREFPSCKVLLMSGHVETAALLAEAENHGHFHTVLAKPVHPAQILEFLAGA
jgi:CheY-like chemotaxis protein